MPSSLSHQAAVASSVVASTLNQWRGGLVVRVATPPKLPLVLYDFEACPFCRLVREAITALHLDVSVRPCPKGGTRFRPQAVALGGKAQFPLLDDPNQGLVLYESDAIVEHLFRAYGGRGVPRVYRRTALRPALGSLASAVRFARGTRARPSRAPAKPLDLWSFEGSPYARLVRERLSELELPYTLHSLGKEHWRELGPAVRRIAPNPYVPKKGGKRYAFWEKHGRVQVPYLEDPNTGASLFESKAILEYLEGAYAARA